jgi:SOS-response transcriptional repressor LexA
VTETLPLPVPATFVGPRAFALKVQGYGMTGDDIYPGDVVLIDPDQVPGEEDIAAVTLTWRGRRGRMLARITQQGHVLESSNPNYPPIHLSRENQPRRNGRAVAVIRRL